MWSNASQVIQPLIGNWLYSCYRTVFFLLPDYWLYSFVQIVYKKQLGPVIFLRVFYIADPVNHHSPRSVADRRRLRVLACDGVTDPVKVGVCCQAPTIFLISGFGPKGFNCRLLYWGRPLHSLCTCATAKISPKGAENYGGTIFIIRLRFVPGQSRMHRSAVKGKAEAQIRFSFRRCLIPPPPPVK